MFYNDSFILSCRKRWCIKHMCKINKLMAKVTIVATQ